MGKHLGMLLGEPLGNSLGTFLGKPLVRPLGRPWGAGWGRGWEEGRARLVLVLVHSFASAPQLSPQGRRGDYRGSQQSIHYVVAASQGRRAPRVTRRPRLLVRLRSTPCGGPQSVRNPPISTTYGELVPRHREDAWEVRTPPPCPRRDRVPPWGYPVGG